MSELAEGSQVMCYLRDKWRPGVLVQMGRKWAYVEINGQQGRRSKVAAGAVRAMTIVPPAGARQHDATDQAPAGGYELKSDGCGFLRIHYGERIIASVPEKYKKEAEIMVTALERNDTGSDE